MSPGPTASSRAGWALPIWPDSVAWADSVEPADLADSAAFAEFVAALESGVAASVAALGSAFAVIVEFAVDAGARFPAVALDLLAALLDRPAVWRAVGVVALVGARRPVAGASFERARALVVARCYGVPDPVGRAAVVAAAGVVVRAWYPPRWAIPVSRPVEGPSREQLRVRVGLFVHRVAPLGGQRTLLH